MTVGDFRNWLLSEHATTQALAALRRGSHRKWLQPCQDHAQSGSDRRGAQVPCHHALSQYDRSWGHLSVRLQPNHPTDDLRGIAASTLDGLLMGSGDAVIGINPASDSTLSSASCCGCWMK
jgi:ethanolamine ammonia-lyase large subunit